MEYGVSERDRTPREKAQRTSIAMYESLLTRISLLSYSFAIVHFQSFVFITSF
jgi:hypothetical protein